VTLNKQMAHRGCGLPAAF